ncbi:YqaA family protein [Rickettsiella grylli]|nr:YqaA family protein [Rickettsiella grylli]
MKYFSKRYDKMLALAQHKCAPYYLFILSFAESSFFPIPPDVMLAPMSLAKPEYAWRYAFLTTVASVLGGLLGYWIGNIAFDWIHPYILQFGYEKFYQQIEQGFNHWNFWILFLVGFTPIPYKLFTIAAGALHVALLPFILGSWVGRGGRFFIVAFLMRCGGTHLDKLLRGYIGRFVGCVLLLAVVIFAFLKRWS